MTAYLTSHGPIMPVFPAELTTDPEFVPFMSVLYLKVRSDPPKIQRGRIYRIVEAELTATTFRLTLSEITSMGMDFRLAWHLDVHCKAWTVQARWAD
jgi:hypothetical protein